MGAPLATRELILILDSDGPAGALGFEDFDLKSDGTAASSRSGDTCGALYGHLWSAHKCLSLGGEGREGC